MGIEVKIDVYLSLNSPWAYLAQARFREIVARRGAAAAVKPADFGEIFDATGGLPLPKRSPARRAYRMMELKRWRDRLGIPLVLEPAHARTDSAPATRLVIAADAAGADGLALATEFGRAIWERDEDIADPGVIAAALARADLDAAAADAWAADAARWDDVFRANTTEAIARGVFGAPSYVLADGEIFWGQDRLDFLDARLSAGD